MENMYKYYIYSILYSKYYRILKSEKWYKKTSEPKKKQKEATILRNFAIQTDRKIKSNIPDIMVKDYKRKNIPSD